MNNIGFLRFSMSFFGLIALAACVPIQPYGDAGADGNDPNRENANKVLFALNNYFAEQGELPKSLEYMVPDYIDSIPNFPQFRVNRLEKSVYYDKRSDWSSAIVCSAKIGSELWRCHKQTYY